jgi:hypothetical protein
MVTNGDFLVGKMIKKTHPQRTGRGPRQFHWGLNLSARREGGYQSWSAWPVDLRPLRLPSLPPPPPPRGLLLFSLFTEKYVRGFR